MRYKRSSFKIIFLLVLVFCISGLSIAFALLSTTLSINGSAVVEAAVWDVKFANLSATKTGDASYSLPQLSSTTLSNYEIILTQPGDSVTFTFDIVNEGTVNAVLSSFVKGTPSCSGVRGSTTGTVDSTIVCNNLTYSLTYADGTAVSSDDLLNMSSTEKVKLTLSYNSNAQQVPSNDVMISNLDITMVYVQA